MLKMLIQYGPKDQRLEEYDVGGCYNGPEENVLWNSEIDGEIEIEINLGKMERVAEVEPIKDENGKQLYKTICFGEHKTKARRIPLYNRALYLYNSHTGKKQKSRQKE